MADSRASDDDLGVVEASAVYVIRLPTIRMITRAQTIIVAGRFEMDSQFCMLACREVEERDAVAEAEFFRLRLDSN